MRIQRKFVHNLSDAEIRSIFMDQMRLHGLIFDGPDLPLIMDGRTRYVRVENRSRGKKNHRSGWYSGHLGDFPNGRFGWLHGENPLYTWSLYQHLKDKNGSVDFVELTEEQIEDNRKKREREERQRLEQEKQRAAFSKALTIIEWARSLPLVPHPYIVKKKFSIEECQQYVRILNPKDYTANEIKNILDEHFPEYNKPSNIRKLIDYQSEHIKYRGFNLLLKGETIIGDPMMLQFIFNKKSKTGKDKHFPSQLVKQNTFLNLGKNLDSECQLVIICEGWATGISIGRFTQNEYPVLVTWDSGNMTSVAIELRRHYPNIQIYSANDNDHTNPLEKNAGVRGGLKTCNAAAGYMITPPFDSTNPSHSNLSDWNDIDNLYPPHESSRIFHETFRNAPFKAAIYDPSYLLLSTESSYSLSSEIEIQDSLQWQVHFTTMARLICKGIQHCRYSLEEQLTLYIKGYEQIQSYFTKKGLDKEHRIYDVDLDAKLAEIFHDFVLCLHTSETHILHDTKLVSLLLKQLKPLQSKIPRINLLCTVRDLIAEKYSFDTANSCIPYHLSINHYFPRSHKRWQSDLAHALRAKLPDLNLQVALALIATNKEIKYWEVLLPEDRIEQACLEIIELHGLYQTDSPQEDIFAEQLSRTKYLQGSINANLIESGEKTLNHLVKVVDRLNEIDNLNISLSDLIP